MDAKRNEQPESEETHRSSSDVIPFIYSLYTTRSVPSILDIRQSRIVFEIHPKQVFVDTAIRPQKGREDLDAANGPPDGSLRAWIVVLGSFLIQFFCFAPTEILFAIFQQHYLQMYSTSSQGSIALIGTLGSSTTYFTGFVSGFCADKFGYRLTALLGTGIMTLALLLASFNNRIWQLYITQGIMYGIGASLVYYPAVGAPSRWFETRRGLALGLAMSGVGVGGMILTPCTQAAIDAVGIYWTLRILAILCAVIW